VRISGRRRKKNDALAVRLMFAIPLLFAVLCLIWAAKRDMLVVIGAAGFLVVPGLVSWLGTPGSE
jgi:hypothetical protein